MGTVVQPLAARLRDALGLKRGIETGTFTGGGTRRLAETFDSVATIELSSELHEQAKRNLADLPNVELIQGDSRPALRRLASEGKPTFYFLDAHWSFGATAGEGDACPVMDEITAISPGHPDDCIVIDDARLFTATPPPPQDPEQWPTLVELIDALRSDHPGHTITVLHDQVIAVPQRAKPIVDDYGRQPPVEARSDRWRRAWDVFRGRA